MRFRVGHRRSGRYAMLKKFLSLFFEEEEVVEEEAVEEVIEPKVKKN
jgi:hypothetical protein